MLLERFEQYSSAVLVLIFNTQRYDLNVLKPTMKRAPHESETVAIVLSLKKQRVSLICMETKNFCFLDMRNYITPGNSYNKYI